jgi:hypothetical protein
MLAADDAGNTDGIGSRYFAVQNKDNDVMRSAQSATWVGATLRFFLPIPGSIFNTETNLIPDEQNKRLIVKKKKAKKRGQAKI